jgi:hypothetical protein
MHFTLRALHAMPVSMASREQEDAASGNGKKINQVFEFAEIAGVKCADTLYLSLFLVN